MRLPRLALPMACLAAAALWTTAPALAQETMKMNISIAQNSHYGVAIDTFATEIEKRTGGRYKCSTSTPARWVASARRSKRCNSARTT